MSQYYSQSPYMVEPQYMPQYVSSGGGKGKKIFGILLIIFSFLILGSIVGFTIWAFVTRNDRTGKSITQPCVSNGNMNVPVSVGCFQLGNYNAYSMAKIDKPTFDKSNIVLPSTDKYTAKDGSTVSMSGYYCTQLCDTTNDCKTAICTTQGTESIACNCTGYNIIPQALVADDDPKSQCQTASECSTIYVRSDALQN